MASLMASPLQSFQPRKEFLKKHSTPHQFILVTFNGADILRCSNFPPDLIASFRRLFEEKGVFRFYSEDPELHVSEFTLGDKMWVGKSIRTERLVTDIFTVLLTHQFRYVTTLAYGRLSQDKQSLMFSRALQVPPAGTSLLSPQSANGSVAGNSPRSNSNTPLPHLPSSPIRTSTPTASNGLPPPSPRPPPSDSGTQAQPPPMDTTKTTFALSLSSKTLRVIHAPRTSTPAILATVRSAWPRGVISESKPEDDAYEFKLKGYSLFSSSTFERDALSHIFTLLRALDQHGFSLITNVCLTTGIAKSRTKDLWIFEAQADQGSGSDDERRDSAMSSNDAGVAGVGAGTPTVMVQGVPKHVRAASDSMAMSPVHQQASAHVRGSTAPTPSTTTERTEKQSTFGRAGSLLRRKKEKESKQDAGPSAYPPQPPQDTDRKESKSSYSTTSSISPVLPAYTSPISGTGLFRDSPETNKPSPLNRKDTNGTELTNDTDGPLTRSQYDFDYGMGGGNTDSAHLYRPYSGQAVPPQQQPPVTVYDSDRSNSRSHSHSQSHSSPSSQPHVAKKENGQRGGPGGDDDDEQILHGNAFRDTTYTDVSRDVPITYKGGRSSTSNINTTSQSYSGSHPSRGAPRRQSTDDSERLERTPEEEVYEREYGEEAIANQRKHAATRGAIESSHVEDNMGRTSAWRKSEKPVVGVLEESDEEHQPITGMPVPGHRHGHQGYGHKKQSSSGGGSQCHPAGEMPMPTPSILRPSPVPVPIPTKLQFAASPHKSDAAPSMPVPSPHSHAPAGYQMATPTPTAIQGGAIIYTYQPAPPGPPPAQVERVQSSSTILPPGGFPRTPPAIKDDRDPMSSSGPRTPPRSPTKPKSSSTSPAKSPRTAGGSGSGIEKREDPPIPQVMSTYNPPGGRISLAPIAKVRSLSPSKELEEREREKEREKEGKGWVLVNVEPTPTHTYAVNPMDQQPPTENNNINSAASNNPGLVDLRSPPLSPRNNDEYANGGMPSPSAVIPRRSLRKKPMSPAAMNKKRASAGSFGKGDKNKKRGLFGGLFARKSTSRRRGLNGASARNVEESVDVDGSEYEDEGSVSGEGGTVAGRAGEKPRV